MSVEYSPEFKKNFATAYLAEEYERLQKELEDTENAAGSDPELAKMAEEEAARLRSRQAEILAEIEQILAKEKEEEEKMKKCDRKDDSGEEEEEMEDVASVSDGSHMESSFMGVSVPNSAAAKVIDAVALAVESLKGVRPILEDRVHKKNNLKNSMETKAAPLAASAAITSRRPPRRRRGPKQKEAGTFDMFKPTASTSDAVPVNSERRGLKRPSDEIHGGSSARRPRESSPPRDLFPSPGRRDESPGMADFEDQTDGSKYRSFEPDKAKIKSKSGLKYCCMQLPKSFLGLSHCFPQGQHVITRQRRLFPLDRDPYLMFRHASDYNYPRRYPGGLPPTVTEIGVEKGEAAHNLGPHGPPDPARRHILVFDTGYLSGIGMAAPQLTRFFTRINKTWEFVAEGREVQCFRRGFDILETEYPIKLWHMSLRSEYVSIISFYNYFWIAIIIEAHVPGLQF